VLFFREHNRQATKLAADNPDWTDEDLYQEARKMVIAEMHHITEEEYFPITIGEHLMEYDEWLPSVDPNVMVEFSTGAFRYGHSEVNSYFNLYLNNTNGIPLRSAYFTPLTVIQNFDGIVQGMFHQKQGKVDIQFVDDLRNFLFGNPQKGGLDLTAINTQRGRDHGLPGINTFRSYFGLEIYEQWSDINPDPNVYNLLSQAYEEIDDCDVYVCGLAEVPNTPLANVGETFYAVIKDQYLKTRNGDNAWYETPGYLTEEQEKEARDTFLGDIIRLNTALPATSIPCHVMALPDGCGLPIQPPETQTFDFVVTLVENNNTGDSDAEENRYVFAVNGVQQPTLNLVYGETYSFFLQISCVHAFVISTVPEPVMNPPAYPGIASQLGCLHQNPIVTFMVNQSFPSSLFYHCELHPNMGGNITIAAGNPSGAADMLSSRETGLSVGVGILAVICVILIIFVVKLKFFPSGSDIAETPLIEKRV